MYIRRGRSDTRNVKGVQVDQDTKIRYRDLPQVWIPSNGQAEAGQGWQQFFSLGKPCCIFP